MSNCLDRNIKTFLQNNQYNKYYKFYSSHLVSPLPITQVNFLLLIDLLYQAMQLLVKQALLYTTIYQAFSLQMPLLLLFSLKLSSKCCSNSSCNRVQIKYSSTKLGYPFIISYFSFVLISLFPLINHLFHIAKASQIHLYRNYVERCIKYK